MSASRSAVYFAYLGEDGTDGDMIRRRIAFMDRQLQWLSGLIEASPNRFDVLVPYVAPASFDADVHRAIERYGFRVDPESVRSDRRNTFEYPGFRAMKTLAEGAAPEHLIYYCHSKGIAQLLEAEAATGLFRWHTATGLTADLSPLVADPNLTRATIFPAKFGWCFYNFFWIKAGYMAGLPVSESSDRYHFEALVGDPADREGYRGVLPLTDQLLFDHTEIAAKAWYRSSETVSPALYEAYRRYARMTSPAEAQAVQQCSLP